MELKNCWKGDFTLLVSHEWVEDCERCHDWGEHRPEGLWRNEKGDVGNVRLCRALTSRYSSGSHQDIQQGEHYPNFRFCWRKLGGARKSEKVRVVKTGNCCVHQGIVVSGLPSALTPRQRECRYFRNCRVVSGLFMALSRVWYELSVRKQTYWIERIKEN